MHGLEKLKHPREFSWLNLLEMVLGLEFWQVVGFEVTVSVTDQPVEDGKTGPTQKQHSQKYQEGKSPWAVY